jgi:hypothetical protein
MGRGEARARDASETLKWFLSSWLCQPALRGAILTEEGFGAWSMSTTLSFWWPGCCVR